MHMTFHATPDCFPRAIPNGREVYKFCSFGDDKIIVGIDTQQHKIRT